VWGSGSATTDPWFRPPTSRDQPYLFERFIASDTAPESVGLGLWIVRLLAEAHHGTIRYRTLAPGAEFTISLPQPRSHPDRSQRPESHHD
jgi:signal transduction histidine kinase